MPIRSALSRSQREAIQSPAAAKVLVEALNKELAIARAEIANLKNSLADTQNRLENLRSRFNRMDKAMGVLESKLELYLLAEIIKYLASAVLTGYGLSILSTSAPKGLIIIGASTVVYLGLTYLEKRSISRGSKKK